MSYRNKLLILITMMIGPAVMAQSPAIYAGVKLSVQELKYKATLIEGQDAYGHEIFSLTKEIDGQNQNISLSVQDKARLRTAISAIEHTCHILKVIELDWGGDIPNVEVEIKSGVNFVHFKDYKQRVAQHKSYVALFKEIDRLVK